MGRIKDFLLIHRTIRGWQAAYRKRHGLKPTELPWEGDRAVKKIIDLVVKLGFLQGYRRQIGIACILAGAALEVATQAEMTSAFPWLAMHSKTLMGIGTYVAIIGSAYKDDPKKSEKKG